jgi:predicted AAA+ superfamily ATPase
MSYQRFFVSELLRRWSKPTALMQVVLGPRQVGKTTGLQQVADAWKGPKHFASADGVADAGARWLEQQWQEARRSEARGERILLVVDEIQKVAQWSEHIKALWDAEIRRPDPMAVCLLGSSATLLAKGLSESLAGRFEVLRVGHWQYAEMRDAFGWDLERYLYFGGYPGGAALADEPGRWAEYVGASLIESALNRDVLALHPVDKPALLRRLFALACEHAAEVLSYNKMLGQLTEAGNASTLAKYQELLAQAGLLMGLSKHSGSAVRRRASSPKWLPLNTALITAPRGLDPAAWRAHPDHWGRLVEAAVGTHLYAETQRHWGSRLAWWRDGNNEVDYVLSRGDSVLGIEVKSGRQGLRSARSLDAFKAAFPKARTLVVGKGGLDLQAFFVGGLNDWL